MANQILQWKALEFEHREKNFGWYVTYVIVVLLLIAYELYGRDYFAAISFFIIGGIALFFLRMHPREVEIEINDRGIRIENTLIPFMNIRHFWIAGHIHGQNLHIETTAYLNRIMIIQLGETDPDQARQALLQFIPEAPRTKESPAQRIARRLRM